MLARLANLRQPGNCRVSSISILVSVLCSCWPGLPTLGSSETQINCSFRQSAILVTLSRLMFMLAGLANLRKAEKPKNVPFFVKCNSRLVYVQAGRACQPSAARKPEIFCSFRQMKFSSLFMFMLAGLANLRQPGNPKIFAVFVKCDSRNLVLFSCWPGLPTVGSPESRQICSFCQMRFSFIFMLVGLIKHRMPESRKDCLLYFFFGWSSQLSAAESSTIDCVLVIDLF